MISTFHRDKEHQESERKVEDVLKSFRAIRADMYEYESDQLCTKPLLPPASLYSMLAILQAGVQLELQIST